MNFLLSFFQLFSPQKKRCSVAEISPPDGQHLYKQPAPVQGAFYWCVIVGRLFAGIWIDNSPIWCRHFSSKVTCGGRGVSSVSRAIFASEAPSLLPASRWGDWLTLESAFCTRGADALQNSALLTGSVMQNTFVSNKRVQQCVAVSWVH